MKRRTMLMLMLLGLGIASFPQVASAQSVEKSKSEHAKSTTARLQLGERGGPQSKDAIERLMQTTGCSRRLATLAVAHGLGRCLVPSVN